MLNKNINLNLYKTFYDVARFGSFSKAATFTYSTQSAISKAIQKLENELECKLFYRKSNGVLLTEKGRELLYYVEKSYGNLLTAERIMLETDELNRGKISIGLPSNLYNLIADCLILFHNDFPNIDLNIITGNTSYLLNALEMHKIDFIIDSLPIINYSNDLVIKKICELDNCFISKNKIEVNSIKELENYEVILPIINTENRNNLDEYFLKNDVCLNKVINMHSSDIILSSVKKGMGIGYILFDYVKNEDDIFVLDTFDLPKTEVAIIYDKKFLTHAPLKFIKDYLKVV